LGELVREGIKTHLRIDVDLKIEHVQDFRNYKVSIEKARRILDFHPQHDVGSIVKELVEHLPKFRDFDNPIYYNIKVFQALEQRS
jgi:nucleoside-diphosphate-sugar epimerase